jgi:hypothetical protein
MATPNDWKRRLLLSAVYAVITVFVSTIIVVVLSSLESPASARQGTGGIEIAGYVFGFPLATGWLFVSLVFGEWRAVHQGQIALIPFVSVVFDALLIFLVWEFFHRKMSQELASDGVLHIDR